MRRVLLLIKGLGRGGAEQLLVSAARHLDRSKFDYEVAFLLPERSALVGELEEAGLPVRCLDGARGGGWLRRLRRLAAERQIELVHAHSPYPAVGARVALLRHRTALVYTEHNVWESYRRATYWGNVLTFPRNDHVFAVSDRVRKSIRYPPALRLLAMPSVETLYHGHDSTILGRPAPSHALRTELGLPAGVPVVGTTAGLRRHKGHIDLLRAAALVKQAVPAVRFVLIGAGPMEAEIRSRASELGLDQTVLLAGHRHDAARLAGAFDVFALASLYEGLSIALLEALALGTPAVVTDVGGLPEVVEHGRQGMVVSPGDPRALADAIVVLLEDADLRERLGREGKRRAAEFDIRTAVRRTEEVYEELLA